MADGHEIRAQIDTEQVRALQVINGGSAAGLMTLLPRVMESPELYPLAFSMVIAIGFVGCGLFATLVHNRLRRKCSLEYAKKEERRQPPTESRLLKACASVPDEPRVCTISVIWMWSSMLLFLAALSSVAFGALKVLY
jgi:hypothetical protein